MSAWIFPIISINLLMLETLPRMNCKPVIYLNFFIEILWSPVLSTLAGQDVLTSVPRPLLPNLSHISPRHEWAATIVRVEMLLILAELYGRGEIGLSYNIRAKWQITGTKGKKPAGLIFYMLLWDYLGFVTESISL